MKEGRLNPIKFGLSWAIVLSICVFLTLISSYLFNYAILLSEVIKSVYGFLTFNLTGFIQSLLISIYFFIDVFIISSIFALVYNKLL